MLFNSLEFVWFLPLVFAFYWLIGVKQLKLQNVLILAASYLFYGWWDWRFLSLVFFSSVIDYLIGVQMGKTLEARKRKWLLAISMIVNLGFLGFFKYCDFFITGFGDIVELFGAQANYTTLGIIVPVGISFYTFQTMSYTIDVYRRKLEPTKDVLAFFAFISFFPQLVAGPIERATNLLPQFLNRRKFDLELAKDGLRQILWGLVQKVVIADSAAVYANMIFGTKDEPVDFATMPGAALCLGAIYFAFQIYGDFAGYSNIAIGTSKLFGFDLMRNFNYPYFSRDIAEFWRRWHISLSTWFRDYLYIPLGGSRGSTFIQLRNVFAIFVVSGFWHGPNWTFLIWGFLNALYFLPLLLAGANRKNLDPEIAPGFFPSFKVLGQILLTFTLTCFAWIFFRALSVTQAIDYIDNIFKADFWPDNFYYLHPLLVMQIGLFVLVEWTQRKYHHSLKLSKWPWPLRWLLYASLCLVVLYTANYHEESEFLYFQF